MGMPTSIAPVSRQLSKEQVEDLRLGVSAGSIQSIGFHVITYQKYLMYLTRGQQKDLKCPFPVLYKITGERSLMEVRTWLNMNDQSARRQVIM